MVQLFQNEVPQAPPVDFYAEARAKSARVSLGKLELVEGKNNVMLKLPAKHGQASGFALDLVQLVFVSE
jgi:hypothetical protein